MHTFLLRIAARHLGSSILPFLVAVSFTLPPPVAGQQLSSEMAPEPALQETVEDVPDSLLVRRLQAIFASIEAFEEIDVAVTEGVVRLSGNVENPEERRKVEEITGRLGGVVYVVNDVEAATDVETRLTPAIRKIREYWDAFVSELPVVAVAVVIVAVFSLVSFLIGQIRRPAPWTGINPLVWGFVNRLIRGILVLIGLLLAFDILGITSMMGAVLGTAGIIGLALGFAFQDIVENYLAGMLLSLRRPFSVNDLVRVGEHEGRVVRLTSREVVLLTFEGNHVRLPNAQVFKSAFTNFTINPRRLFSVDVGIGVDEDARRAMQVGIERLESMPGVLGDPGPFARVIEIGDSSLKVRYHAWVDQREADYLKVWSEATRVVKLALDGAGIELPEPIYRVHMRELPARRPDAPRREGSAGADAIDVRPDGKLDEQVREDLERSEDENLLS